MKSLTRSAMLAALAAPLGAGCLTTSKATVDSTGSAGAKTAFLARDNGYAARAAAPDNGAKVAPVPAANALLPSAVVLPPAALKPVKAELPQLPALVPAQLPAPVADAPLTLEYFENLTDARNPTMRRDLAAIEAARGSAVQAGVMPNPQWNANNPYVFNGRNTSLNAGITQEIPVAGKKRLDEAAANEATRQAEFTYKQNRLALLAQVRQQFYQVLVDQRRVEVLTYLAGIVKQTADVYGKVKNAGDAVTSDVLLAKIDYDTTRAKLRNAEAVLDGDRKQLEALAGVPGCVTGNLVGSITGPYPVFDEAAINEFVMRNHTQVKAAQSAVQQNRLKLKRAEVDPIPNPTIGPAYFFGVTPGSDQFGINLTFPIPIWDLNKGNIRSARANVTQAAEAVDTARLVLINQAANLLSQYLAAKKTVDSFEAGILADSLEVERLAKASLNFGNSNLTAYLVAHRTAAQANSDYVDALQNLWSNATQLSGLLQMERFPER